MKLFFRQSGHFSVLKTGFLDFSDSLLVPAAFGHQFLADC